MKASDGEIGTFMLFSWFVIEGLGVGRDLERDKDVGRAVRWCRTTTSQPTD